MPSALRAALRAFKFVPDEFVEPVYELEGSHPLTFLYLANTCACLLFYSLTGGEGGIRTLDTYKRIHEFQSCSLNRSDTSPKILVNHTEY